MEVKKAPHADLEKRKSMFLQIGFVLVLALVLVAFEWSSYSVNVPDEFEVNGDEIADVIIPITYPKDATPPPPPPKTIIDIINLVDDNTIIEDDNLEFTTESNEDIVFDIPIIEETRDDSIFIIVEKMPSFPGGNSALRQYLGDAVQYPSTAIDNQIQGKVYVSFVVSKTGEVKDVTLLRGIHPSLDTEALRVVQSMPRWEPGEQRDKKVNVSYTVPINFSLR
ncbi:energy transducer TonB [Saccharicrinis aurantiacus]|uniref:energy transducer TonB n=1 Tax=Saccharicrinis aurantiacus TaxID=1849719 RepID=UPI0024917B76|nr:energy transducer TonB [Saccharicrinis aurantiacus]